MTKSKIVCGILSIILLTPSTCFGYDIPVVPKVTPPNSMYKECADQFVLKNGDCVPLISKTSTIKSDNVTGLTFEKPTLAKLKSVIGGAYSQLLKLFNGLFNRGAEFEQSKIENK